MSDDDRVKKFLKDVLTQVQVSSFRDKRDNPEFIDYSVVLVGGQTSEASGADPDQRGHERDH